MAIKKDQIQMLEMGKIDEPAGRIRLEINQDEIKCLAESIDKIGQLQAILVRPVKKRFEIVFGHRRFLAHQRLGRSRIATTIRELNDVQVALMRATENIERSDISPIEEAAVYRDLCDNHGMTVDQIGLKMGKTPGIVKRRMDLLRMPPQLQKAVHEGKIGYSVAESLWSLGDITAIDYYLPFAIEHGATNSVVRGWVQDHKHEIRRKATDTGGSPGLMHPSETRPVYVACDLCNSAMEIGQETVVRSCPSCMKALTKAIEEAD